MLPGLILYVEYGPVRKQREIIKICWTFDTDIIVDNECVCVCGGGGDEFF
jgi:hypothetical protein